MSYKNIFLLYPHILYFKNNMYFHIRVLVFIRGVCVTKIILHVTNQSRYKLYFILICFYNFLIFMTYFS